MKQAFLIVLAIGLLVGGAQAVALAQMSGAHSPSDDSWTGATRQGSAVNSYQGGGYAGYPPEPDYTKAATSNGWMHMGESTVLGKIAQLDFENGTMTLNDGEHFTLPKDLEYTSLPTLGEAVEVTFSEQNGQKVVRWIDPDDSVRSNHSS